MDTTKEPVVWLVQHKDRHEFRWSKPEHLYEALACEPLYTHPVKELTDEEIMECERWVFLQERMRATNDSWNFTIEFARTILRKAQEK